MVGRDLSPLDGGMALFTVGGGRHVAAGLVAERRKASVVAAHAGGGSLYMRERSPVTLEALRRDKVARKAVGTSDGGGMQAAAAAMTARATAGDLVVINQVRTPGAGAGVTSVAHRR